MRSRCSDSSEQTERPPAVYDDGHLRIDLIAREVRLDGVGLRLSRKEFDLLRLLLSHRGRIVTQQQLLREIRGPGHQDDSHYLRVFIGKIRNKLGDSPAEPSYIESEPGVGYRFIATES